ncbi:metal-dependent hydrolase [Oceanobacillus sp. 143]|uniref:Metal-dependent hydrolase n=1 Tax=Oceanobacillus zhaokaii TaxID=2052660 RepID=A0A345PFQ5_9BACI|nr:metal-dependent hydrolase [Oceanobacillus zhaokaii]AXI08835.1 metal-dependent hydrolase [Oceanobacillus zhaokaii]QGS68526.1 metal-dependent hydrolase [Oceanobacillus sp. 143]
MNGTAHVAIGAAAGFVVANNYQSSPAATILLVGIGGISGLIPDLDIDGKLRNKITLSHKVIQSAALLIGMLMIVYSIYEGTATDRYLGIAIGLAMMIGSSFIKQRHMLTITGIGVLAGGISHQEMWLLLLGIYILVASFVAHRSYTHSILGVIFFGIIVSNLEVSLGIEGIFYTGLAGYISHLVADSKLLPFNKRGIKLFLPISSKEI